MITVFVVALILSALAMALLALGLLRRPRRHCGDRCTCAGDEDCAKRTSASGSSTEEDAAG